jgi:hypothetical protein
MNVTITAQSKRIDVDKSKEELRKTLYDYIKAGETHSILVGFSVDTVNGTDERLLDWCDRMVGYVLDAMEYQEKQKAKTPVKARKPRKSTAKTKKSP